MERKIKFRGLTEKGNWEYGELINTQFGLMITNYDSIDIDASSGDIEMGQISAKKVRHETVGQFTGLKDNNNKDIYEGDITFAKNCYLVAKWINGGFRFVNDTDVQQGRSHFQYSKLEWAEIIGNVYENPELLIS